MSNITTSMMLYVGTTSIVATHNSLEELENFRMNIAQYSHNQLDLIIDRSSLKTVITYADKQDAGNFIDSLRIIEFKELGEL